MLRDITQNRMLAGLPAKERKLLLPACESVDIHLGETLGDAGTPLPFIHFPVTSAISMTAMQDHEHMVEVTLTGKEGSSGSSVVLGDSRSPCTAMVQIPGSAIRISTSTVMERFSQLPYLTAALARHNLLLMRTAVISVACSRFHNVSQRVARWLKAHWYRTGIETFPFSAQFLAAQVGADTKIVADTLQSFEVDKLIRNGHNKVTIVDQEALGKQVCECYELAKQASHEYLVALHELARSHSDA
jgi:CRP-like cAMP-binding protein